MGLGVTSQADRPPARQPAGSALEDFLDRTVVYEEAGAPMPRSLIQCAFISALLTLGIGALGVISPIGGFAGVIDTIHQFGWIAVALGLGLVVGATALSHARSVRGRIWMRYQLGIGAIVPGIAVVLLALYVVFVVIVVALIILTIVAWFESL